MNSVLDMNTDYLHRISKLSLFDDDFMNIVFQNDKCVQLLLDIILDHDIRIIDKDIQHRLDNIKRRTAIINVNLKMYKFAHLRMYNFIISQNLHNNL